MTHSKYLFLIAVLAIGLFSSCEKGGKNEEKISHYGDSESHNIGKNCMECHKSGGAGEGWFNAAGTVFDSTKTNTLSDVTIKLFSKENGTGDLKYTFEGDAKGNFYNTKAVEFGDGLFPSIKGPTGTKYMSTSVKTGACNSCHGVTTDKLWAY